MSKSRYLKRESYGNKLGRGILEDNYWECKSIHEVDFIRNESAYFFKTTNPTALSESEAVIY